MTIKLGVIMDPIQSIAYKKDTTLAMLVEAQNRGWEIHYFEQKDLYVHEGIPYGDGQRLQVRFDPEDWFEFTGETIVPLSELDVILMRKDPPFDMNFIYTTFILELAERLGTLIVNKPQALRDHNEKFFITHFPQCCAPTLISSDRDLLRDFVKRHSQTIFKPLDGMGGASIFRVDDASPNTNVIIETLTEHGNQPIMAQLYIPDISHGDKRILMVDGEPIPYALARIPTEGESRGNLAAGGRGEGRELSDRDRWICEQVAPTLKEKGLIFVGLDVIGNYLTEINVTSPTCVRELDNIYNINISAKLMDAIAKRV